MYTQFNGTNVVGIIPGKDVPDEAVVLLAHHDHLGVNATGAVYTGAIDNAASVGAVLAAGRALMQHKAGHAPRHMRRSVILLLSTGEEFGLFGATYFAAVRSFSQ